MNEIIVRIDELRIKSGLSKAALANKISVTPTTLSNWSVRYNAVVACNRQYM